MTTPYLEARGLRKTYGSTVALDGVDLRVEPGRILGLVGPNGAGKSTLLNAIVGLTDCDGTLSVLGRDPWTDRARLVRDVSFVSDVAVLPRWMRVSQLLAYVAGVHPRFERAKAEAFLERTAIGRHRRVRDLSKGMVAQLHLAVVMAIDARLMVLDEPTLGLDVLFRKRFYDALLTDYLERDRTVVVATHEIDELQHVLTDLAFLDRGRLVFRATMEDVESRWREVAVHPDRLAAARALGPVHERASLDRAVLLFEGADPADLAALGEVRAPGIADLFAAVLGGWERR